MSRVVTYCVGLSFIAISVVGARAADPNPGDWDARYKDAVNSCILKSMKKRACVHVTDGNPLDPAWMAGRIVYKAGYYGIFNGVGYVRRKLDGARMLVDGTFAAQKRGIGSAVQASDIDNDEYWRRVNNENNYVSLKKWANYKAKKDGLEDCQKACLATCISSRILEYDDSMPASLSHYEESLGREKGICRDFGAMAGDIMRSMGLNAGVISGEVYDVNNGSKPKHEGGHAMVHVQLARGDFILEPQQDSCEFYDHKFTKDVRNVGAETLNADPSDKEVEEASN